MCAQGCGGCNDCGGLECGEGPAGLDGLNSFTLTTATFVMPNVASNVTINVSNISQMAAIWGGVGQPIWIESAGAFEVVSTTSATMTVKNSGGANNASPAATIALGVRVSPSGLPGTSGTTGSNGVSILFQNISVSSPTTIGNSYTDVVFSNAPITVPENSLLEVGDMLRIEVAFQNDVAAISSYVGFLAQIKFGGDQVFESTIGSKNTSDLFNGKVISLDLIVTATNTLSSRINRAVPTLGSRVLQWSISTVAGVLNSLMSVPAFNALGVGISPITTTLSNSNAITVQLKNTSGVSTDLASVTSILVTKFKKLP